MLATGSADLSRWQDTGGQGVASGVVGPTVTLSTNNANTFTRNPQILKSGERALEAEQKTIDADKIINEQNKQTATVQHYSLVSRYNLKVFFSPGSFLAEAKTKRSQK